MRHRKSLVACPYGHRTPGRVTASGIRRVGHLSAHGNIDIAPVIVQVALCCACRGAACGRELD